MAIEALGALRFRLTKGFKQDTQLLLHLIWVRHGCRHFLPNLTVVALTQAGDGRLYRTFIHVERSRHLGIGGVLGRNGKKGFQGIEQGRFPLLRIFFTQGLKTPIQQQIDKGVTYPEIISLKPTLDAQPNRRRI